MASIDQLTDLKLKGHLPGTLGPIIAITTLTAKKKRNHTREGLSWRRGSCVLQKHMVDCIKVPMEPTPTEELNKEAVVTVHWVLG